MGIVYRGEDIADGTTVAIKVLRGAWVERPDAIKRFTKEARILATIKTPYVVNYIELNEDDGVHYLVLEYVQGRSSAGLVDRRRAVRGKNRAGHRRGRRARPVGGARAGDHPPRHQAR